MTSRQRSSNRNEHEVEDDVHFVESGSEKGGGITEDGEYSVSIGSEAGAPAGLSAKQKAAQEERSTLGKKESQAIFWLRKVVLYTLIFVSLASIITNFAIVFERLMTDYGNQYEEYASQIHERFISELERKMDAANTLSSDMTTYAKITDRVLPFVTFEKFEFNGANARIAGDTVMIFYMPYITAELKDPWEKYTAANLNHSQIAYDSEQNSKAVQDMMFEEEPHELNDATIQLIESYENHETSRIWFPNLQNMTHVSGWVFFVDEIRKV